MDIVLGQYCQATRIYTQFGMQQKYSSVGNPSTDMPQRPKFDLGLEWLLALLKPGHYLHWEDLLTQHMHEIHHYLILEAPPHRQNRSKAYQGRLSGQTYVKGMPLPKFGPDWKLSSEMQSPL